MAEEHNVVDESAPIGPDGNPVVEEPVAEAEVAEAAEAEGAEAEKPESKPAPEGYVPVGVVQEMREEQRSLKTRLEQTTALLQQEHDRQARIRQMHEQTEGAQAAKTAEAALVAQVEQELGPCPDAMEDPLGARDWQRDRRSMLREAKRDAEIADLKKTIVGRNQTQDEGQFLTRVHNLTQQFIGEHPDYLDAYKHVMEVEQKRAVRSGKRGDDVAAYLQGVAEDVVKDAIANNENPASRIYDMAKDYGWQSKPAAEEKPETKPAAKLEKKAEGQRVRTMPSGAAQSEALPDLEEISKMPWADYQKKCASDPKFKSYVDELLRNA